MTDRKDKIKNITIIFLLVMLILTFFSNTIMNYSLVGQHTAGDKRSDHFQGARKRFCGGE